MDTFLARASMSALAAVAAMTALATPARGNEIQLNFATVNQSLWGPGNAIVYDDSWSLPDPYYSTHLDLSSFDISPTGALLDFLGVGDIGPSLKVFPSADITAGITAGYHLDSGSISLNYPREVSLNLPTGVQSGQTFQVGLAYPNISLLTTPSFSASNFLSNLNATAGSGYTLASMQSHVVGTVSDLLTPQAGFTTTSPFAEAYVKATLTAGASIHGEACFGLGPFGDACPFDGDIDLGSTSFLNNTDILKLSTLTGLSVLGEPVIDLANAHLDIPGGYGSIDFHSPSVTLEDDTLNSNGTLSANNASGLQPFLSAGFDVDQLVPLVGTILHNSLGPFSYDLLSVEPTVALTLHQSLVFEPTTIDVDLRFSDPVICESCASTAPTRNVQFAVGQDLTLLPATVGTLAPSQMTVTPTFSLVGTLHNRTYVTLDASLDVSALALTAPVHEGPVCCDPIPLFSTVLPGLDFNDTFRLGIPSITTAPQQVARSGNLAQLLQVDFGGLVDDQGNKGYQLTFGNLGFDAGGDLGFNTFAYGTLIQNPLQGPIDCNPLLQCNPCALGPCDTYFEADQDVFFGDRDLGRLFCIQCIGFPSPDQSPTLFDLDGNPVFFSDLTTYPYLPTAADIVNPASPYYDAVLASSAVLYGAQDIIVREGGTITNNPHGVPVPEPNVILLMAMGLAVLWASRRNARLPAP